MPDSSSESDVVAPSARAHIEARLAAVAKHHAVRILYAAESGSRAWGFASPDSDFDVRFIYVHPTRWYVSLGEPRDVIEAPLDEMLVDLAGWDVRKALRLLLRSNPTLYEWLVSPIVYVNDGHFANEARRLFEQHASQKALAHHYFNIARGQWRSEIEGREEVKLKKYFYVVRPLLSLRWVIDRGTPPPMQLCDLVAAGALPEGPDRALADLVTLKRDTPELGRRRRIPALDQWLTSEFEALDPARHDLAVQRDVNAPQEVDDFFRATIGF